MKPNYQKITEELVSDLKDKQREVISRRFGLGGKCAETLEAIGQDFGVCRERVRQIQESALEKIRPKLDKYGEIYSDFLKYFQKYGGVRQEDKVLADLGGEKFENEVCFLLSLKQPFQRYAGDSELQPFWYTDKKNMQSSQKVIGLAISQFQKNHCPMSFNDLSSALSVDKEALNSYLEVSKVVLANEEGCYGLKNWPEINPKGIKDKAYLVFKKYQKPLHFSQVAKMIPGSHLQTVHNELIRDSRFVLIGRGVYALAEWGFQPGQVREVISGILKTSKKPLSKEEILKKVMEQRMVKENTVLLNLSNKKYFLRNSKGKYIVKEI